MAPVRRFRSLAALAPPLLVAACGGGAATLHPAHVLPEGRVSAGAGASGQFVFGSGESAIERGRAAGGAGAAAEQELLEGAVSNAALGPGLAPWVGARVGIGGHNEGGLTYTGRTARVDARHAFGSDAVALSVGAGASALLLHPGSHPPSLLTPTAGRFTGAASDLSATGFGLDIPVIVGWRSTASIVEAWAGARVGVEHASGFLALAAPAGGEAHVSGERWYGGGLVGAAIGIRPIWVAFELDVAYQRLSAGADFPGTSGAPSRRDVSLVGVTATPTGAIVGKF